MYVRTEENYFNMSRSLGSFVVRVTLFAHKRGVEVFQVEELGTVLLWFGISSPPLSNALAKMHLEDRPNVILNSRVTHVTSRCASLN
jgi:hypothetical protein